MPTWNTRPVWQASRKTSANWPFPEAVGCPELDLALAGRFKSRRAIRPKHLGDCFFWRIARRQVQLVRVDGEVTARATDEPSPPAQHCHQRSLARRRPAWRAREVDRARMCPRS